MHTVTYPKGHGAAVTVDGLGRFEPGETKTVRLSDEQFEEFSGAGCVLEVAAVKPKKKKGEE